MINNILISLAIFLLILISSFAMYLPLRALIRDKSISLRYAIPVSISIEIIVGYIFYNTSTMRFFPLFYLIFVVLINIWFYFKLKPIKFKKIKINWLVVTSTAIISIVIFYTRYYDSFKFFGPGTIDAYAHLKFVKNLFDPGYLTNGFYAPGFHIILMPIAKLVPFADLYRFTGPAIGIVTLISFVLLFRDYLKNKILLLFLLTLLALPIYNQFILQTIGFFSSAMTFIYFASFIVLLSDKVIEQRKINLSLFLLFAVALALTVPYLFVVFFPAFLIIFFIVLVYKRKFTKGYPKYLLLINSILIIGFLASFAHVYIQSNILKRSSGFPIIKVSVGDNAEINDDLANKLYLPKFIQNNSYLRPMIGTGYDLIKVKNIRSANSMLGLGAYIWIGFSLFLVVYALRKKNSLLLAVAVLIVFFGLCTQTGMFEMSNYRGRSGWYLLMLSIFGLVLFFDQIYSKKMFKWLLAVCLVLAITGFFSSPQYYRPYYDEEFRVVSRIAKQYPNRNITLITTNRQLSMVAENITPQRLVVDFLRNDNPVIVIEKEIIYPDPVLSQRVSSTNNDYTEYNNAFESEKEKTRSNIERIQSNEDFKSYLKFFENEYFTVYEKIGNND